MEATYMFIDRWTDNKDVVHKYMKYNSVIKKNEMMPFGPMHLESIIWRDIRERQIPYDITYMYDLKYDTNELIWQNRTRLTDIENKLKVTKEERQERDRLGGWY